MNLELVVDARSNGVWLALLRDGKLIELHEERGNSDFAVGDIYLGRVRRIVPSLNAAFVDVGYEKDAFKIKKSISENMNGSDFETVQDTDYYKMSGENF